MHICGPTRLHILKQQDGNQSADTQTSTVEQTVNTAYVPFPCIGMMLVAEDCRHLSWVFGYEY